MHIEGRDHVPGLFHGVPEASNGPAHQLFLFDTGNLDSILKSRDTTLPTKVCLVKAMVFPVVMGHKES